MEVEPSTSLEVNNTENDEVTARVCKRYCCIPQCESNNRQNPELSFHKIPKNPELKKKWMRLLKRKGVREPGPSYRVCSMHFVEGKKRYTNDIPTIFATKSKARKSPSVRVTVDNHDNPQCSSGETSRAVTDDADTSASAVSSENNFTVVETEDPISKLKEEITILEAEKMQLQKQHEEDTEKVQLSAFRLERFIGSDGDFRFYTGFPNYSIFKAFYDYLSPACEHLVYHGSNTAPIPSESQIKCGKQRSMSPEQELFLVLTRLRLGLLLQDIAHRFNISPSSVSRIFKTWIPFLHQRLRALPIWPSRKFIDDNMPSCFKQVYPKTRVIIDCTEFFIEMPSSCRSQSITFSSYKNHNTAKGLIGISPNGYPSFVSSLYAGRTSDKKITNDCGILNLLEPGDELMADRGFDIESDMPNGVFLNIPPLLDGQPQLSAEDEAKTRKIASVRVHVERAIARIKNYRILQQVIPLTLADNLDQIWGVCSYLTLFLTPIIKEKQS